MKAIDREMFLDIFAGSTAILLFVANIQLGRFYHGYHGMTIEDLVPLVYIGVSYFLLIAMRWVGLQSVWSVTRLWAWLSLLVGLGVRYRQVYVQEWGGATVVVASIAVLAFGFWACRIASIRVWRGLRRMIIFLPGLMVFSPLIAGAWLGETHVWLAEDSGRYHAKTATLILLFDEMNAESSFGLRKVLIERGLKVNFKPVSPVHNSTTQVVPAVFTGLDFTGASACGLSTICAEKSVLDFSKIFVQRNDVDMIGFHHPYCAINGLRFCQRLTTEIKVWDAARWDCAAQRVFGINLGWSAESCQERAGSVWTQLQDKVFAGVFLVPTLKYGGVFYAHLPIPHPPANGTGSLTEQYVRNLNRAEELLVAILDRMDENKVEPRILIFSDHPLRQSMWCSHQASLFDAPCAVDPSFEDEKVPLIVASRTNLPDIRYVQSNKQISDVLRDWLRQ